MDPMILPTLQQTVGYHYPLDTYVDEIEKLFKGNHNYLELNMGNTTKKITVLPLFVKAKDPNSSKLIKSKTYFLVNPFNKQIILSFVNKDDIDNT
jgi:hypothetical protein